MYDRLVTWNLKVLYLMYGEAAHTMPGTKGIDLRTPSLFFHKSLKIVIAKIDNGGCSVSNVDSM